MSQTTIEIVAQARAEADEEFRTRAERALVKWPVRVSETEIAGVSCQIVEPEEGGFQSTILYFFGGGYLTGSPENDLPITAALSGLGSYRVIAPRYGLAPEFPFPIAINQASDLYQELAKVERPAICGESAGGGLALAMLHQAHLAGAPLPPRIALISPWCDLREEATVQSEPVDDPLLMADSLRFYAATYLDGAPADDARASPLLATFDPSWPATLLTTGSRDRLRHSVLALGEQIVSSGGQCEILDVEDMPHVFEVYDEYPEALRSLQRIAQFLIT